MQTAFTLSGAVVSVASALAVLVVMPSLDGVMRGARAAYTGALLAALPAAVGSPSAALAVFLLCAPPMLGVAAATAAPRVPLRAVALLAVALSVCALALPAWPARVGLLGGAVVAGAVARGMARNKWRALRLWTHAASLGATLVAVVPSVAAHVAAQVGAAARLPSVALLASRVVPATAPMIGAAVALLFSGTAIVWVAGRVLVAAGGTPDPVDPPHAWCSTGLYAHLRHPMQLGQFLAVAGAALLWGTWAALLAAGAVVVTLLALRGADVRAARRRRASNIARPSAEECFDDSCPLGAGIPQIGARLDGPSLMRRIWLEKSKSPFPH